MRQDTRSGDYAVLGMTRAVEENQEVMSKLNVGAILNIEVGLSYRSFNGRYYTDAYAWRVEVVKEAGA